MDVIDYSFAHIPTADICAAGYGGVIRYLSPPPNDKNWTADQLAADRAAGLYVGFVWETTELRATEGFAAGQVDGQRANDLADQLGIPNDVAIYFACDHASLTPGEVRAYFAGLNSTSRRPIGVYGSQLVTEAMADAALARYKWQVSTWNTGQPTTAHIVQEANTPARVAGADHNTTRAPDWGAWAPPGASQPPPPPVPVIEQEEPEMWLFNVSDALGGGTYQTDGDRAWGVPSPEWLDVFFFGTEGGNKSSGIGQFGPLAEKHLGMIPDALFWTFRNRDGSPRTPPAIVS